MIYNINNKRKLYKNKIKNYQKILIRLVDWVIILMITLQNFLILKLYMNYNILKEV